MSKIKNQYYLLLPIIFLTTTFLVSGQNLVQNGSFEEVEYCPKRFNTGESVKLLANGWSSPSRGTPDIFNTCNNYNLGVENLCGITYPKSGNGFAGFILYDKDNIREYLQTQLTEPLKKGQVYHIQFYYKYATYSMYESNKMGIGFSKGSIFKDSFYRVAINIHYRKTQEINFSGESKLWHKYEVDYKAKGGERFLLIGNFERDATFKTRYWEEKKIQEPMLAHSAYYYLDDVSVTEFILSSDLENVSLTDTLILRSVKFEFDKYILKDRSSLELDKLVKILLANPTWKVKINGHTDSKGDAKYNLELSKRRARAVGSYLVAKGISKKRITPRGYGSTVPTKLGTDEENRRVEVEFYL